ncbi:MAG: short-chain fatty acyl-CoA regulator family protein [Planctomycetes bacterium]|nr:short-chain fatty acyl-CoA regulator family protein [Planctomycetota bacterium]
MAEAKLGGKVRALRRRHRLTQAALAERLGISPSYLNLIEHDRRPLTARLLLELARLFEVDLEAFREGGADDQLGDDLEEAFGDPLFDEVDVTREQLKEVAASAPGVAKGVLQLYRAYRSARAALDTMGTRLAGDLPGLDQVLLPSEEVNDLVQRAMNYWPSLEAGAEALWRDAALDGNDLARGLVAHLERVHRVEVRVVTLAESGGALRRFDPDRRVLHLAESLPPRGRTFQLAHQVGLLDLEGELDRLTADPALTSDDARALARGVLANYFAGAVLMPYERFHEAARRERHDVEVLGHRFRTSFEQVCHRLTTLRRPGAEGVPFHMVRVDIAGNISKRFSGDGIRFARFSGACPRWNVHAAFLTPGMIRVQLSRMPDGAAYFCFARTVHKDRGSYRTPQTVYALGMGCAVEHAPQLVYADGVDLDNLDAAVPIGITCRVCERTDCQQRAFPSLQQRLQLDPNVKTLALFAPVTGR